jgi:hypothetical protein
MCVICKQSAVLSSRINFDKGRGRGITMNPIGAAFLEFNLELNKLSKDKGLRDGLSRVLQIGETLWVANDKRSTGASLGRELRS